MDQMTRWRSVTPHPTTLAASQRVRTALLSQRAAIERAWGRIEYMSDQVAPGRLVLRTARGHILLFGLHGDELWVEDEDYRRGH